MTGLSAAEAAPPGEAPPPAAAAKGEDGIEGSSSGMCAAEVREALTAAVAVLEATKGVLAAVRESRVVGFAGEGDAAAAATEMGDVYRSGDDVGVEDSRVIAAAPSAGAGATVSRAGLAPTLPLPGLATDGDAAATVVVNAAAAAAGVAVVGMAGEPGTLLKPLSAAFEEGATPSGREDCRKGFLNNYCYVIRNKMKKKSESNIS